MEEELERAIAELVEAGLLIEHWDDNSLTKKIPKKPSFLFNTLILLSL